MIYGNLDVEKRDMLYNIVNNPNNKFTFNDYFKKFNIPPEQQEALVRDVAMYQGYKNSKIHDKKGVYGTITPKQEAIYKNANSLSVDSILPSRTLLDDIQDYFLK